jgi:pimeloyl-ACP methyl ester carboxylesterase
VRRGHGRSTRDSRPYGYDLMADDVVALMDVLKVPKADIVGWSDGAILGLAMRHSGRVGKVFCLCRRSPDAELRRYLDPFASPEERPGIEHCLRLPKVNSVRIRCTRK